MLISALAALMSLHGSAALADSLVTVDGDVLLGSVTKTSTGYTVQTNDGPVDVAAEKVKRILYDHPPAGEAHGVSSSGAAPAAPGATAKKKVDLREITALTQQGEAAMAAGEFADARDAFTDLLSVDMGNALAGRGLGYAYLKMDKPVKAVKPLELAAINPPVDRNLTIALAASLVASHNPMRAAKFVKSYLEAHPTPLDEPMINTLGISLSQADRPATKSTLFIDGVKLYNKLNSELEAGQPGKKRWGIEWQDADEVTRKMKERTALQKKVDDAWNGLQPAQAALQSAQNDYANAANANSNRQRESLRQAAQNRINTAQSSVDKYQKAYDEANTALSAIPGPVWPAAVALEDVDLSMSPGGALASASSTGTVTAGASPTKTEPTVPPVAQEAAPPAANAEKPRKPTPAQSTAQPTPPPAAKPAPAEPAHVTRYAVAFAISPDTLVTAASTVEGASDIEITNSDGKTFHAEVLRTLHGEGLALLKADGASLPSLMLAGAPTGGSLTCMGFPEVELFNPVAKQMTATSTDQTDTWTVSMGTPPRLPGGPLMKGGAVVGVELGDRDSDLGQVPAATLKSLLSLVADAAHPSPQASDPRQAVLMVMAIR